MFIFKYYQRRFHVNNETITIVVFLSFLQQKTEMTWMKLERLVQTAGALSSSNNLFQSVGEQWDNISNMYIFYISH